MGQKDWWNPFLWIILTPIVTVPLSMLLFGLLVGTHDGSEVGLPNTSLPGGERYERCFIDCPSYTTYEYSEVAPTVVALPFPGLLNLAPFVWAFSKKPKVRIAGIVAGLLGLLRLSVAPTVLMLLFTRLTGTDGTSYFQWSSASGLLVLWGIGFLAWLASVFVFALALCFMPEDRHAS